MPFWAQKSESAEIYSIKDDLNRTVTVSHPAVKIVCLDEAHAENIVALRAVRQLTAVTDTASSKWVPKKIKRIAQNSSALQIAALEPDLVVMETDWAQGKKSLLDGLRKEGIPYAVFDEPHWGSFALYLERLGTLTGRDKEADLALISSEKAMDKSAVRADSVENKSLFVICGADFSTCAWDSWGARIAATAGAESAPSGRAPTLGREQRFARPATRSGRGRDQDRAIGQAGHGRPPAGCESNPANRGDSRLSRRPGHHQSRRIRRYS